jgi:hypothetical protein
MKKAIALLLIPAMLQQQVLGGPWSVISRPLPVHCALFTDHSPFSSQALAPADLSGRSMLSSRAVSFGALAIAAGMLALLHPTAAMAAGGSVASSVPAAHPVLHWAIRIVFGLVGLGAHMFVVGYLGDLRRVFAAMEQRQIETNRTHKKWKEEYQEKRDDSIEEMAANSQDETTMDQKRRSAELKLASLLHLHLGEGQSIEQIKAALRREDPSKSLSWAQESFLVAAKMIVEREKARGLLGELAWYTVLMFSGAIAIQVWILGRSWPASVLFSAASLALLVLVGRLLSPYWSPPTVPSRRSRFKGLLGLTLFLGLFLLWTGVDLPALIHWLMQNASTTAPGFTALLAIKTFAPAPRLPESDDPLKTAA